MQDSLMYPAVKFTGLQARAVARGFALQVLKSKYRIYACAIMPDHAHLVIARHHYNVTQVVNLLKGAASRQLEAEGLHPLQDYRRQDGTLPSPWSLKCWKVYLDSHTDVSRAIDYTNDNPTKEGLPPQEWSFIAPYV